MNKFILMAMDIDNYCSVDLMNCYKEISMLSKHKPECIQTQAAFHVYRDAITWDDYSSWLNIYFDATGENRTHYEIEVKRRKGW